MRRLLLLLLALIALAAPTSALAAPDVYYYGVNTKVGDLTGITNAEISRADHSRWGMRVSFDKRIADGYTGGHWNKVEGAYGGLINWVYANRVSILPVSVWTNADGSNHRPANQAERDAFWHFNYQLVDSLLWNAGTSGFLAPNIIEVWNEPNCMNGNAPGPGQCKLGGFTGMPDYKTSAFDPAAGGARYRDPDINVVVGGLGYGTTNTNGFEDAGDWVSYWEAFDYEGSSDGYSVHPYGHTNATTHARESTGSQSVAKANAEFSRVCSPADDGVLVTETGRRTDVFSQSEQQAFLSGINNYMGFHASAIYNYLSIDQSSTGSGSVGVFTTANTPKIAYGLWDNLGQNGWQAAFDLVPNCQP